MKQDDDEDQRVRKLIGEITKLLPERSKIKTDLLYFKYAPILVMLIRWYGVSQFYDNKMEITLGMKRTKNPSGSSISSLISFTLFPFGKVRCCTDCA